MGTCVDYISNDKHKNEIMIPQHNSPIASLLS